MSFIVTLTKFNRLIAFIPEGALVENGVSDAGGRVKPKGKKAETAAEEMEEVEEAPPTKRTDLQSFEEVMQAMDEELAKARAVKHLSQMSSSKMQTKKGKGKEKALEPISEQTDDPEDEMDAELRQALAHEGNDSGDETPMDYNLIKNFLESFRSQGGLSGPVSNLAGRLQPGWTLPRDDS